MQTLVIQYWHICKIKYKYSIAEPDTKLNKKNK